MYPCYTQLISLPKSIPGVEVSYWTLDLQNQAQANIQHLKDLVKPTTKMIILNNPNNPLGTVLPLTTQHEIVDLARNHGLTILVDEIFRPLFYDETGTGTPQSFIDLPTNYENIVVTSSMSKAWGLSGTRIGWLVTRNASILSQCFDRGLYTIMALSNIDEAIATEALSERCRPQILAKHLDIARRNIALIEEFVRSHKGLSAWIKPRGGGTGFVRFFGLDGQPVDDVSFCKRLMEVKGILLAPGSLCFGVSGAGAGAEAGGAGDFRGYVRVHITVDPGVMERSLAAIGDFLEGYSK